MTFFRELKRRNVYKVAVAYAVVAWLLIQIAAQTFPFLEIPGWAVRLVIMLALLGFPVAVVIAWAFELTPEGIVRTESVPAGATGRKRPDVDLCGGPGRSIFGRNLFLGSIQRVEPIG